MQLEVLERVGLTKGEAKTYVALLELGQTTTGPIVEKSGLSTSKTYKILKRLENKGLVGHIVKRSVMHWSSDNPKRILELLERQEKEILEKRQEIKKILPELMKKIELVKEKQQAEVYMGMKGLISVFNEETDYMKEHPGEVNYVIGVTRSFTPQLNQFFNRLEQKREALNIKEKLLFGEDARGAWPVVETSKRAEVRYLPFSSLVSIDIYGETSFISVLSEEPIFFVIKSKSIAHSFKAYFEILWKHAKI